MARATSLAKERIIVENRSDFIRHILSYTIIQWLLFCTYVQNNPRFFSTSIRNQSHATLQGKTFYRPLLIGSIYHGIFNTLPQWNQCVTRPQTHIKKTNICTDPVLNTAAQSEHRYSSLPYHTFWNPTDFNQPKKFPSTIDIPTDILNNPKLHICRSTKNYSTLEYKNKYRSCRSSRTTVKIPPPCSKIDIQASAYYCKRSGWTIKHSCPSQLSHCIYPSFQSPIEYWTHKNVGSNSALSLPALEWHFRSKDPNFQKMIQPPLTALRHTDKNTKIEHHIIICLFSHLYTSWNEYIQCQLYLSPLVSTRFCSP